MNPVSKILLSLLFTGLFFLGNAAMVAVNAQGKIVIIGGGTPPGAMINTMISSSGLTQGGYGIILSMKEVNDSASWASSKYFPVHKYKIPVLTFSSSTVSDNVKLDSLRQAKLIFLTGTDQEKILDFIGKSPILTALKTAYQNGALIAGNSAGASVFGKWVITGKEKKHPNPASGVRTIESDNVEVKEGLGLLDKAIIDPHFIKSQRMNRLLTAVIEHPDMNGIGLDEETALVIEAGNKATIVGNSQVVVISGPKKEKREINGLLSVQNLVLSIYLSGDQISF